MTKRTKGGDITTIAVTVKTKRQFMRLKKYGETSNELLKRLIRIKEYAADIIGDRRGQAGSMFFIIVASVAAGIIYLVLGKIMDLIIDVHNTNYGYPISFEQTTAVTHQVMLFNILPVIILIIMVFTVIKVSVSRRSGQV